MFELAKKLSATFTIFSCKKDFLSLQSPYGINITVTEDLIEFNYKKLYFYIYKSTNKLRDILLYTEYIDFIKDYYV